MSARPEPRLPSPAREPQNPHWWLFWVLMTPLLGLAGFAFTKAVLMWLGAS